MQGVEIDAKINLNGLKNIYIYILGIFYSFFLVEIPLFP